MADQHDEKLMEPSNTTKIVIRTQGREALTLDLVL